MHRSDPAIESETFSCFPQARHSITRFGRSGLTCSDNDATHKEIGARGRYRAGQSARARSSDGRIGHARALPVRSTIGYPRSRIGYRRPSRTKRGRGRGPRERGHFMRFRFALAALAAVLFAVLPTSAGAIIGGQPDGNNHPYVGYADNGVFACSTTLLSPTVMLTAAHCFSDSTSAYGVNSVTGGSIVRTTFDSDLTVPNASRVWHWGTYYFDPQFAIGSAGGLPGFDTHDVAIIVFTENGCRVPAGRPGSCGPIDLTETGGQHGVLPPLGLVDTLRNQTPVDLVGYGVRNYVRGVGPCLGGPCKPGTGDPLTRYDAQAN